MKTKGLCCVAIRHVLHKLRKSVLICSVVFNVAKFIVEHVLQTFVATLIVLIAEIFYIVSVVMLEILTVVHNVEIGIQVEYLNKFDLISNY